MFRDESDEGNGTHLHFVVNRLEIADLLEMFCF